MVRTLWSYCSFERLCLGAGADHDFGVGREGVGRDRQVDRRRAAADPTRGVEDRAMAGAEPAVVGSLVSERHAAEMGAAPVDHEPRIVAFLDTRRIRLRVA